MYNNILRLKSKFWGYNINNIRNGMIFIMKITLKSKPCLDLFELATNDCSILLNNIHILIKANIIFVGHNLEGKYIKG